ncbi:MAG: GNAT family N-acetyltransferase [Acidimicrobiaceae bacterium]|nr:GNAT family N-acetyltransferase [Acidimicrobiaceae bacterium]
MLVIRRLERADVGECIRLARDAHVGVMSSMREIYGDELFERLRPDWSSAQAAQVDAWFNDPQTSSWVAELDSVTVGFIVTTCDLSTGMGMLEIIAVHPDQQRQGIGARLISHALAHLRDAGVAYVEAYIRDFAGHAPAHQALRSQGFTRRAVMPVLLYRATEFPGSPAHRPARIRRITEADVDACVTFGVEAFRSVYASFEDLYGPDLFGRFEPDWEASQASYIRRAITDSDDETWVYDLEGRPAGFVVLKMDDHGIADIDLLAVDPAQQGQGIAPMLNRVAFERSQEESMSYVVVATADDPGHAPARRSYESAGFVPMPIQWNLQIIRL